MHATAVRALALTSATLVLAVSGCGGKAIDRMLTLPTPPATHYQYTPPQQQYGYWPNNNIDPYTGEPLYRTDPLVRFPSDTRLANYNVGNILSRHLAEFSGAFGANFATLHLQLPYGKTEVRPVSYVMASPNALVSPDANVPPQLHLNLLSARDTVSFVTYGLYSPTSTQHVLGIDVHGAGSFAIGDEHGLYVGVRQFGEPRYNWYGPFKANERWHVDALRDSNYGPGDSAYVTLAVFNGDNVRLDSLSFDMGG